MLDLILKEMSSTLGVIGILGGALWTIWVYSRSNRIKTAEFLLQLEKEYTNHIETFLAIEYDNDYKERFFSALQKQIRKPSGTLTDTESKDINTLEAALRFFFVSLSIKWLRLDSGYLDHLNCYYLRKLRSRDELSKYVEMFWPQLYFWSELAGRPFPIRCWRYMWQVPARLR